MGQLVYSPINNLIVRFASNAVLLFYPGLSTQNFLVCTQKYVVRQSNEWTVMQLYSHCHVSGVYDVDMFERTFCRH